MIKSFTLTNVGPLAAHNVRVLNTEMARSFGLLA
jgi:hypothetical protein